MARRLLNDNLVTVRAEARTSRQCVASAVDSSRRSAPRTIRMTTVISITVRAEARTLRYPLYCSNAVRTPASVSVLTSGSSRCVHLEQQK